MLQLSAEQMSEREQRRMEIEQTFDYDGYQVARRELFAHLRDPAIIIRRDSITFNTACIAGLEDVVYVNIMFNSELKRIVVKGCNENDRDALRWCVAKPDKRKSRKMSCRLFSELLYKEMDWSGDCRYKILGYRIEFEGEALYVFDLVAAEVFHERKKKSADHQSTTVVEENKEEQPVNPRKGYYPEDVAGTFGVPVEQHRQGVGAEANGWFCLGWNAYGYTWTAAKSIKIAFWHQGGSLPFLGRRKIHASKDVAAEYAGDYISLCRWTHYGLSERP